MKKDSRRQEAFEKLECLKDLCEEAHNRMFHRDPTEKPVAFEMLAATIAEAGTVDLDALHRQTEHQRWKWVWELLNESVRIQEREMRNVNLSTEANCPWPCPKCNGDSIHFHLGRNDWGICNLCGIRWSIGSNLLSLSGDETNSTFDENRETLLRYRPHRPSDGDGALGWDRSKFRDSAEDPSQSNAWEMEIVI
jgi:hypothetical protein